MGTNLFPEDQIMDRCYSLLCETMPQKTDWHSGMSIGRGSPTFSFGELLAIKSGGWPESLLQFRDKAIAQLEKEADPDWAIYQKLKTKFE